MFRRLLCTLAFTLFAATAAQAQSGRTVVDIAAGDERFDTLVAAVQAAGLAGTLSGDGPFTVFAPTDAAFAALPEGTVATLLQPENRDRLRAILTYHVLPGRVMSGDLPAGYVDAKTVNGASVRVNALGAGVDVNDADVVLADIEASNGVIHVIDRVLLPPES